MQLDRFTLMCNGAGALLALVIGGYFASSLVYSEPTPSCGEQFATAASLPFETASGDLLSPIELQARAGRREYGLLDNARVIRTADAPASAVLEVSLGAAPAGERNGIGMRWSPPGLSEARVACLSYDLWLPEDFEFASGGILPGLFGGADTDDLLRPDAAGFAARLGWRPGGPFEAVLQVPLDAGGTAITERSKQALPRGRWIEVAQELRLNTPGQADGTFRVWLDGELLLERRALAWRKERTTAIGGVLGLVGRGTHDRPGGARSAAAVRLTPFALRWE